MAKIIEGEMNMTLFKIIEKHGEHVLFRITYQEVVSTPVHRFATAADAQAAKEEQERHTGVSARA
jgi:hypothetical protein